MYDEISDLLELHQLRKTQMRRRVLELFLDAGHNALASSDIEERLDQVDRITLYRTLKTFERKGIIHQAVDGSGTAKYALCSEECDEHEHHDEHAHFHCQACGKTICLEGHIKPQVRVPEGFTIETTHLVLNGFCKECSQKMQ